MKVQPIQEYTEAHYGLLSQADPNHDLIEDYVKQSYGFQLSDSHLLVGVLILTPEANQTIELKNIAIAEAYRHRGLAQHLIRFGIEFAKQHQYQEMLVGTGTTSFEQLYLYQKMNFRCYKIRPDFFTKNYADPIIENGLHLKDMIMLQQQL
ncbi:GNAT family N-acetyltransferase [Pediococcus siamensis]|uniref:GNAT family N-acetyltransferase n=1 Tax=Pediococcus siamensis TaxID=381829 RepID=UPI0039A1FC4B